MLAIDAKNVTKLYKIPTGKVTAIVGSNGFGKSTLLQTMVRLLKPTAGTVTSMVTILQNCQQKRLHP
jgi:ABC-type cobalamin/Fe3+-siderophores transport system ATPase subunit